MAPIARIFRRIVNTLETTAVAAIAVDVTILWLVKRRVKRGKQNSEHTIAAAAAAVSIINGIEMNNDHTYKIRKSTLTPIDQCKDGFAILCYVPC